MQGCENGIWLKQTDIGFKINMMLIITAKLNNSNVLLQGYSDQLFPGSSANVCHLYLIILK